VLLRGGASELFNILVNPVRAEFALCWHRDDVKGSVSEVEERAALAVQYFGVRERLPFLCNSCSTPSRIVNNKKKGSVEYVSMSVFRM
jgi:hypothetical protein